MYPVRLHVIPGDVGRGIQITAIAAQGESFMPQRTSSGSESGELTLSLPRGTYALTGRVSNREETSTGSTRVTVTGHGVETAELHLEPLTSLPIEIAVDPASQASSPTSSAIASPAGGFSNPQSLQIPDPRMFNLRLTNLQPSGSDFNQDAAPQQREDKTYEFRAAPGEYRLLALSSGGQWAIESATYGTANLATDNITIASGSPAAAIRLLLKNTHGTVTAAINFPASVDMAWIYMVPKTPGLTAVQPNPVMNAQGATQTSMSLRLPEGTYSAFAFDRRIPLDLRDPDAVSKLPGTPKTVEIANGATANVTLDVVSVGEVRP